MSRNLGPRTAALAAIVTLGVIGQGAQADTAGAVSSTKTELKNGQLRMEGQAFPARSSPFVRPRAQLVPVQT